MRTTLLFLPILLAAACGGSVSKPVAPELEPHHDMKPAEDEGLTLASLAKTALRLDGLGAYHRDITTASRDAQGYFDQGLRLTYAFNHDEAVRSFAEAGSLDPDCAMCWWGAALTLGPNYNVPMLPERSVMAWDAVQKAIAAAPKASKVEQALIGAIAKRYGGPEPRDPVAQQPFNVAYADAMREVAKQFPADLDVQVLFAEAMMDVTPWHLWTLDGQAAAGTEEIVTTLEAVLAKDPTHPGANHYYIHAVEASPHPEKAVASADRLGAMMPGAGHLVHMPAHIYQRVGRYHDAAEANRAAIEADVAYNAIAKPWGYYPMYLGHNYGFLAFAGSMLGRSAESLEAADQAVEAMPPGMIDMMPGMDFFVAEPLLVKVRFGKWEELLAEPRPEAKYQVLTAFWLHAHGMASASTGKLDDATKDLSELQALAAAMPADLPAGNNVATDVANVAAKVLEARIAEAGHAKDALALWAEAVAMADKLAYSEPADWFYPVRHLEGAALLAAKKWKEADAVFREDLKRNPENGWALFGLAKALTGEKKPKDAKKVQARFDKAWAEADVTLTSPAF